jgi:Tfp pilus assembly protein PilF
MNKPFQRLSSPGLLLKPICMSVLTCSLTLAPPPFSATLPAMAAQTTATNSPLRVVVLPFENLTRQQQDDWLGNSFAESLTMGLVKVKQLQMIERSQIDKLLKEQQFSQSAFGDPQTAPTLGRMLGANIVVVGSYQKVGEQLQANVRFVDVETGRIDAERVGQVEGAFSQIFQLQKDLAQKMVQQLDVNASPKEVAAVQAALSTTESTEAYRLYTQALTHLRYEGKPNTEKAEQLFEAALKYDPQYAEAYAGLARTHLRLAELERNHVNTTTQGSPQKNHLALAEANVLKAMAINKSLTDVYLAAGGIQRLRGNTDEAIKMSRAALQLNPRSEAAINLYLNLRLMQTQFQVSVDTLLEEFKALGVNPEDPWLKYNLSAASLLESIDPASDQGKKRREWSKKLLLEAQKDLPDYPGIPLVLAGVALESGDRKGALDYVNRVITLSDNYPYNLVSAAHLLLGLDQEKRAIQLLESAEIRYPDNRQLIMTKAMIMYSGDRKPEAKAIFERLQKTAPDDPFVVYNQGLSAMLYDKDYNSAVQYFQRAKQLYDPQKMHFSENFINNMLSMAYLNLQDYAAAIPLLETQIKDPLFRRMGYEMLALSYSKQHKDTQALQTYQEYLALYPEKARLAAKQLQLKAYHLRYALTQRPKDPALLNDLAQVLQGQYAYEEATTLYTQALSLAPDEPVIHFNLGSLLLDVGKPEQAQAYLAKAVALRPDYTKAWFNLALVYIATQKSDAARAALMQLKALDPNYPGLNQELEKLR